MRAVNETITINGQTVTLKGEDGGAPNYYKLTAKADDDKAISITTSVVSSSGDAVTVLEPSTSQTRQTYTTTQSGTITHANTSSNTEQVNITVYDSNWYSAGFSADIPAGSSEEDIAGIISKAVQDAGDVTVNWNRVLLEGDHPSGTADFSLRAVGSANRISFSVSFSSGGASSTEITDEDTSTTSIIDANFTTEESYETTSGAVVSLTGFYGSEDAADSLSAAVNTNTQNNASILFEVTGSAYDETLGAGTITLSA